MLRLLRFIGLLLIHTAIAIIATAIAVHAFWKLIPAHSITSVLWKECILDALFATSIGFSVWRTWRTSAARWTWVLAVPWFAFGFGFLTSHGPVWGSLLPVHSGGVLDAQDARSFFAFTVPLIRTTFYSLGAYISSVLYSEGVPRTEIG